MPTKKSTAPLRPFSKKQIDDLKSKLGKDYGQGMSEAIYSDMYERFKGSLGSHNSEASKDCAAWCDLARRALLMNAPETRPAGWSPDEDFFMSYFMGLVAIERRLEDNVGEAVSKEIIRELYVKTINTFSEALGATDRLVR